jgi:glucokinase
VSRANAANPQAIGLDIGGTKIAAIRMAADGTVLARERAATPADDMRATIDAMIAASRSVLAREVAAVGIGAAGLVEAGSGILRSAPNLAWRDARLAEEVTRALGVPAIADNDANVAAWGEFRFGAGRTVDDMLLVAVGTGIGGGIVSDGRLFRGAHGFAAEIGHIIVEPGGPLCGCGNRGCWEQVGSGHAISREGRAVAAREPGGAIAHLAGGDPAKVTGSLVTEAARDGDPAARRVLSEVGRRLGEGIAGLVNILDPSLVVVGGGAIEAGELMLAAARDAFAGAVEAPEHRPPVPLVAAVLGNDAGAIGAAALALEELLGVPVG